MLCNCFPFYIFTNCAPVERTLQWPVGLVQFTKFMKRSRDSSDLRGADTNFFHLTLSLHLLPCPASPPSANCAAESTDSISR